MMIGEYNQVRVIRSQTVWFRKIARTIEMNC